MRAVVPKLHHQGTHMGNVDETVVEMQQERAERMLKDFVIAIHDHPQAGDLPLHKGANMRFLSTKEMHGTLKRYGRDKHACGTLWAEGKDEVLLEAGRRDELRLMDVVCAVGINASDTLSLRQLVRKGITISLTYTYFQDPLLGIFDHIRGLVPLRYELTAEVYPAQAKMRMVEKMGHARSHGDQNHADVRVRRSAVGITLEVRHTHVSLFVCGLLWLWLIFHV